MKLRNRAIAAGLTAVLTFGTCVPVAFATPQSELAEASQRLESLGSELASIQDSLAEKTTELENTSYQIGEKEAKIEVTQEELDEARAVLGGRMRSSYKSGGTSLLEVLLGATSLDDVISRVYYMDKIATSDAETINEVVALEERLNAEKDDLEQTKATQQAAVDDLQAQVQDYTAKVAEAQQYYDSLDAQIQAEIAAQQEAEENARIQAALAAAEQERQAQQASEQPLDTGNNGNNDADDNTGGNQNRTPAQTADETPDDRAGDDSDSTQKDAGEQTTTPAPVKEETPATPVTNVPSGGGLSSAYAAIGSPYVYGAAGPSSFDCSGLVCYCYGYARGRTTYSMIASLQADGGWKTSMSQLSVGDLVFTSEGHVGIYVGGGQMIHAPSPGRSVEQASVYAFIGGGTY